MTAAGRPAGDSRWTSTGTPATRGRLAQPEQLLQLHREHRLLGLRSSRPGSGTRWAPRSLRRQLVEPGRPPRSPTAAAGSAPAPRRSARGRPAAAPATARAPATRRHARSRAPSSDTSGHGAAEPPVQKGEPLPQRLARPRTSAAARAPRCAARRGGPRVRARGRGSAADAPPARSPRAARPAGRRRPRPPSGPPRPWRAGARPPPGRCPRR